MIVSRADVEGGMAPYPAVVPFLLIVVVGSLDFKRSCQGDLTPAGRAAEEKETSLQPGQSLTDPVYL